ncbi:MAG: polysaccharide biosynthesis C-terminal domain-containing protein, partial [Pirellulales bacterium]|nr:polysaccharide biosynthesis C-terminal domain-containing protein [Pirellulales bacterium]
LMRQIAARRTRDDQAEALSREVRDGFTLQVIATLTLGAIGALAIYRFVPPSEVALAAACLVVGLAHAWVMTGERVARGLKRFALSQGVFRIGCPGLALAIALAWWVVSGGLTAYQALVSTAAAYLLAAGVLLACGVASLRTGSVGGKAVAACPPESQMLRLRLLLTTSLPMLVISGLALLMNQLDVLMLRPLVGDAVTGQYAAAAAIAVAVAVPLQAVNIVSGTFYAEQHSRGDVAAMNQGARRYMAFILPTSLAVGVALIIFSPMVLALFGKAFAGASIVVFVLVLGHWINAASGSSALFLCVTGQERACAIIFAAGAALNVILNTLLIPAYGAVGAATATAISLAAWNIGAVAWMRRLSGVDTSAVGLMYKVHRVSTHPSNVWPNADPSRVTGAEGRTAA